MLELCVYTCLVYLYTYNFIYTHVSWLSKCWFPEFGGITPWGPLFLKYLDLSSPFLTHGLEPGNPQNGDDKHGPTTNELGGKSL